MIHLPDFKAAPTYDGKHAHRHHRACGARTLIGVPMIKDNEVTGVISIYRQEVRPFTEKQIELVQNFAAPGRHRHREHAPAQRIARVAAAADGDLGGAAGHLELARRPGAGVPSHAGECDPASARPSSGILWLSEADGFRAVARPQRTAGPGRKYQREPLVRARARISRSAASRERRGASSPRYHGGAGIHRAVRALVEFADLGGARTLLFVPMLKESELVGAIAIYRQEVRPFTDKQIELVTELRHPGRHRHREHAPAQRAA